MIAPHGGTLVSRFVPARERDAMRSASRQFIGAGCCPGGTPSYQTRHMPAGGICPGGIPWFRPHTCAPAGAAKSPERRNTPIAEVMFFMPINSARTAPA